MDRNKERIDTTRIRHRHSKNINIIGTTVRINDKVWRIADKTFRYGREWQYTLSHENIDGTYESMRINKDALETITGIVFDFDEKKSL